MTSDWLNWIPRPDRRHSLEILMAHYAIIAMAGFGSLMAGSPLKTPNRLFGAYIKEDGDAV